MAFLARILAPVEFAERCAGTVRYAKTLADQFGSELTLLHVVPPAPPGMAEEVYVRGTAEVKEKLDAFLAADLSGSSVRRIVVKGDPARKIVQAMLRALASTAVLVTVYYVLPLNDSSRWLAITMLVIGLVLFTGLVTVQVRWVATSRYPRLRAIEALATSIPLFLLLFASTYVVMAAIAAGSFSQPMTHTNALYFTVTVFATVGFGDITAKTEAARLLVTGQMILDLIILGVGVRIIVGAITRGRQRRAQDTGA